ncbi:hypothetical protein AB3X31_16755 [Raoultella terrigena]|uniref:hypothetical protein n=1 Tax=Raoultella terrigena TaxID=577 RepID=UPI00349F213A
MKLLQLIALVPLLLLPTGAFASSEAAWKEFDKAIQRACLAQSDLPHKKVAGTRIDFSDDVGYSALIISGKRVDKGKVQTVKSLCLYNRQKQTAALADMP